MKTKYFICRGAITILFFSTQLVSYGQFKENITLKDLEVPEAPAMTLLDEAPSIVNRPNSPRAFVLSVINSFQGDYSGLPKNYALELTPFWFFSHKKMNFFRYAGLTEHGMNPFAGIKMASLSMAYVNKTDQEDQPATSNISIGLRSTLIRFYRSTYYQELLDANLYAVGRLKRLEKAKEEAGATPDLLFSDPKRYHQIVKRVIDSVENSDSLITMVEKLKEKPIFAIDGAVAYNAYFSDNNFSSNQSGRFGAWLTLNYSYRFSKNSTNYLNIYGVGRYISDNTNVDEDMVGDRTDYFDFGGKFELEFDKLTIAYEFIHRINDSGDSYRSAGLLKYKINDNIYLTGAFGRNFGETENLITLLGINWGIGTTGNEKFGF